MIAYVKGILTFIHEEVVIVDVNGIGYEIICPDPFVFQGFLEKEIFIYTYHHVREDVQSLYGFKTEDEKYLFEKLISVSGIGSKGTVFIVGSVFVLEFLVFVVRGDEVYVHCVDMVGNE